ncbi:hypothetical protein BDY21DRAFT_140630 [Lineolata rhizophorae]|uniref:UBA domain-containing protein n=1 Tax=Lineolata rhizophorae TaxID=578093 RepID=A0A6A6PBR2_9PEZI|nr:hypothetical protein BDY21DRAFT_140630 [Lineolata rhizophorae]
MARFVPDSDGDDHLSDSDGFTSPQARHAALESGAIDGPRQDTMSTGTHSQEALTRAVTNTQHTLPDSLDASHGSIFDRSSPGAQFQQHYRCTSEDLAMTQTRSKRRKTDSDVDLLVASPLASQQRKAKRAKTYGAARAHAREGWTASTFEEFGSSARGEASSAPSGRLGNDAAMGSRAEQQQEQQQSTAEERAWSMRDSLRAEFERHEPMVMFPEVTEMSSTEANDTSMEERLLEEARREAEADERAGWHASSAQPLIYEPAEGVTPSPLSSPEYRNQIILREGGINEHDEMQSLEVPTAQSPSAHSSRHGEPSDNLGETVQNSTFGFADTDLVTSSSALRRGKSEPKQNRDSSIMQSEKEEGSDKHSADRPSPDLKRAKSPGSNFNEAFRSATNNAAEQPKMMTKAQKPSLTTDAEHEKSLGRDKKPNRIESPDPLSLDEIDIAVPKDKYVPRPTRSRSARVTLEGPVDWSVRPEKASKSTSKRRKTTSDATSPNNFDMDKLHAIQEMGFSPTKARDALDSHGGSVEGAISTLVGESTRGLQGSSTPRSSRRKSTKPRQPEVATVAEHVEEAVDAVTPSQRKSPVKAPTQIVEVEVHSTRLRDCLTIESSPQGAYSHVKEGVFEASTTGTGEDVAKGKPSRKRSARDRDITVETTQETKGTKTSADNKREAKALEAVLEQESGPAKPQKRGRGRPRKNREDFTVQVHTDKPSNAEGLAGRVQQTLEPLESTAAPNRGPQQALHEVDANATGSQERPVATTDADFGIEGSTSAVSDKTSSTFGAEQQRQKDMNLATVREQTPTEPTGSKSNAQPHSPLSKGKVPYRVGLSRRQRIAPLLKSVKK